MKSGKIMLKSVADFMAGVCVFIFLFTIAEVQAAEVSIDIDNPGLEPVDRNNDDTFATDVITRDKNCILNGSFEKSEILQSGDPRLKPWKDANWDMGPMNEIPLDWYPHNTTRSHGVLTFLKGKRHIKDGRRCIKLSLDKKDALSILRNSTAMDGKVGKYRLSVWVRGRNARYNVAFYQYDKKGGAGYAKGALQNLESQSEWTQITTEVSPTRDDISRMYLLITCWRDPKAQADAESFLCIDDVRAEFLVQDNAARSGVYGGVTAKEVPNGDERSILVENKFYEARFNPKDGGRLRSWIMKPSGKELALQDKHGGFFIDHFVGQRYPGELMYAPYEYEIIRNANDSVTLKLWRTATSKEYAGIRFEKSITLYSDKPIIDGDLTITNTTRETKSVGIWVQHCPGFGGSGVFYRPTTRGVSIIKRVADQSFDGGEEWVRNFTAGWMAGLDKKSGHGVVFLLDYDNLRTLYNSEALTAEWFTYDMALPPGKSYSTKLAIVPVNEFAGFAHASPRLVMDIEPISEAGVSGFEYVLSSVSDPLKDVEIRSIAYKVRSKTSDTLAGLQLEEVGFSPSRGRVLLKEQLREPIALKVTVKAKGWSESFEWLYSPGVDDKGIAGYVARDEYLITRPKQNVKMLEEPTDLSIKKDGVLDVLLFYGLYTNWYGIEKAVEGLQPSRIKISNAMPEGASYLPGSMEELSQYDVVVLSNVERQSLRDAGDVMLCKYVEMGGSLLLLGGPTTYGQGDFNNMELTKLLPVKFLPRFDVRWEKSGAVVTKLTDAPALEGVDFASNPRVFWIHDVKPDSGADVLLKAGKRPFLITGKCGKGRVAIITGTPMGNPERGQVAFWEWTGWQKLLANILKWLAEESK